MLLLFQVVGSLGCADLQSEGLMQQMFEQYTSACPNFPPCKRVLLETLKKRAFHWLGTGLGHCVGTCRGTGSFRESCQYHELAVKCRKIQSNLKQRGTNGALYHQQVISLRCGLWCLVGLLRGIKLPPCLTACKINSLSSLWACCLTVSVQRASSFRKAKFSYRCGDWSLDTASHDGKSGFLQSERSSSRALTVSASPCSRYSSSVSHLNTNFLDCKRFFIFLKWNEIN